jgi:hypothetical protein
MPTIEIAGTLQLLRTVELSSWVIAAIALIGAALVVANTLIMAVSERTRELGVLAGHRLDALADPPKMLLAETLLLSSSRCGSRQPRRGGSCYQTHEPVAQRRPDLEHPGARWRRSATAGIGRRPASWSPCRP